MRSGLQTASANEPDPSAVSHESPSGSFDDVQGSSLRERATRGRIRLINAGAARIPSWLACQRRERCREIVDAPSTDQKSVDP